MIRPQGSAIAMEYADADQTRRTAAGATQFAYNQLGLGSQREGSTTTYFRRDNEGTLVQQAEGQVGNKSYYILDALGSVMALTDGPAPSPPATTTISMASRPRPSRLPPTPGTSPRATSTQARAVYRGVEGY